MKIPKRITPCPIIEAIVEIRFESKVPSDAVFGVIYKEFKDEYTEVEKLPILQLPEVVRTKDHNLRFQPHYKLIHENYLLQIGPNVLSVVNINEYVGWSNFSSKIMDTFSKLGTIGLIDKADRLGIRYINFFEVDIYDNINLKFLLSDKPFISEQTTFKSTLKTGKFLTNLQILNNGNIIINKIPKSGSIIDIDTYIQDKENSIFSNFSKLLEDGHEEEKLLFFKLLKKDFINKFHPEY